MDSSLKYRDEELPGAITDNVITHHTISYVLKLTMKPALVEVRFPGEPLKF